ncbi:hypothetical protein D3C84_394100 [compost metagenome]
MVVVGAKFAQQHVKALGLRHEGGRAQQVLDVEAVAVLLEDQRQQVLGQQHAHHVIVAFADHRVAGVGRVDHGRQELAGCLGRLDADHLRARDHDVPDLQVSHLDGAFDDGQRFAVQQFVLVCIAQQLQQLLAVFRLVGKSLGEFTQP